MTDMTPPSPNISENPALADRLAERLAALAGDEIQAPDEGGVPDGYISDAELLAWLQAKSTGQYDSLRDLMNVSSQRTDLIQKLNNLKGLLDGEGHPDQLAGEMEKLLAEFEGTPYYTELHELLAGSIDVLRSVDPTVITTVAHDVLKNTRTNVTTRIQGEIDRLGKVDQLALVQIQQLMADARETAQLASNVLGSRGQTSSGIIGNIRG